MHSNTDTSLAHRNDGASRRPLKFGILSFVIYLGFGILGFGSERSDMPAISRVAPAPQLPSIPARASTVSITDFGARPDATTDNAKAIQKAIKSVSGKGGAVTIPAGVFLSGPIQLASHVELRLEKGATLRLLPFSNSYPQLNGRCISFITAQNCTDITICGQGTIDGQGAPWWPAARANQIKSRPQLIALDECERVLFENFTTLNPPNTHFSLGRCKDVTIRNLTLRAPADSHNTDGINFSGKNYLIENCDISTGDDNIVINGSLKRGWNPPMSENIVVRHCAFGAGHGMSIGSYTSGGVRGVLVEDCAFNGTTVAIRMKSARGRGGLVENLTYRDITVKNARAAVYISSYYPKDPKTPDLDKTTAADTTAAKPMWRNILIENLAVTDSQTPVIIWGLPELPVTGVTIRNATFATQEGAAVNNAAKVLFDHVKINCVKPPELHTYQATVETTP